MEAITSANNSLLKLAASLREKKHRDRTGLFVAEGIRLVEEAVQADWKVHAIIGTEKAYSQERVRNILHMAAGGEHRLATVSDALYGKITETEQPQGLMAVMEQQETGLETVTAVSKPLFMILDGVQDPGNVGALIRTADAAGCHAIFLTGACADVFSGKALRSTMGSLFHIPIVRCRQTSELIDWLQSREICLAVTSLEAAQPYFESDLTSPLAIVFGNEGAGVSAGMLARAEKHLYIPILGKAESLNVNAAAAVILYEAVRQRGMVANGIM